MDLILRIDLNVFCFLFAAVLVFSSSDKMDRPFIDYRLFMAMLCTIMFELAADTLMWLVDPAVTPLSRAVLMISSLLYYLVHPVAPMCYAAYAMHQVSGDIRGPRIKLPVLAIPAAASAILSIASLFTGWYFYLDASGIYRHGPLFPLFAAASYIYLIFSFMLVVARRGTVDAKTFMGLIVFPVLPAIAGLIQMNYYGLVLIWPAMVISLLVIYVSIQQRKLSSDYLTGAFNRRRLDEYLGTRIRDARPFAGFLADLDDFKSINDRFGHAAGDEALVETVGLIRASLRSEDFLARYAGDEFVVILPLSDEETLEHVVWRLRERFAAFSSRGGQYCLRLSIGQAVFDPRIDENGDKYIMRLDSLMYREKETKKALKRKK